jgi:hypothetical protein
VVVQIVFLRIEPPNLCHSSSKKARVARLSGPQSDAGSVQTNGPEWVCDNILEEREMTKSSKKNLFIAPSQARLARLIEHGYFPSEMPPPFTTSKYAKHASALADKWDGEKIRKFFTRPEAYSVPRYGHARRTLSIVNPVNQLHVADLISKNWVAIRKRLKRSTITEFDPRIVMKGSGRAVTGVDFDGVSRRKVEILGSFGRYVKTDVARFYPSIYTHSIPWALIGKEQAKSSYQKLEYKTWFGNLLDKAVAAGQQNQTVGIPIGPDTSRILSELIVSEVEVMVSEGMPDLQQRAVRYVDDILIGLRENETPSVVLSVLSTALYEFELELNAEKTETRGIGHSHSPEWIHYVRTFELSGKSTKQRDDLDSFFEQAFFLADANPRENVLLFAAKRAASFELTAANMAHFVRWLLYSARRSPSCLTFIAEHLAALNATDELPNDEIAAYILQQIPLKAEAAHTDEVAWLLFWARETKTQLPAEFLKVATSLRSSTVAMLSLDIQQRGLIIGKLDVDAWMSTTTSDGLRSEMWLAAYEATKKDWWPKKVATGFITGHQFFGDIWARDIEFYDPTKKARKKIEPVFPTGWAASGAFVAGYPD